MNRPYHAPANQRPMAPSSSVPVNPPATRCRTKTATKTGAHLASRPLHNAFRPISEPTLVNSTAKPGRNKDASRKKREGQVKRVERKQKKRSRQKKILNETRRGPRVRFHGSKVAAAGVIRQLASSRSDDRGVNKTLEKLAQSTTAADPSSAPLPSFPSDSRQSATEHGLARQLIGQLGKTRLANPSAPLVNGHHRLLGGKKTTTTTTTTTTGRDATKNRSGRRPNRQPRADKKKTRQRTTASVARRLMAASTNQRPEKR